MKIREKLKTLRAELKALFAHSIYEAAEFNGLAIEYPEGMPPKYTGRLDTEDKPRFIAVNRDLPEDERVYIIAREIGRYAQLRGRNSLFVDRPWKWNLLATAPAQTRDFIHGIDVEVRAYWIMFWHADRNTLSSFPKRHPRTYYLASYPAAVSDFVFWKLRIRNALCRIRSSLPLLVRKLPL